MQSNNEIIAYYMNTEASLILDRGRFEREWMEESKAYRCLPLSIANQHGWAFYLKDDIQVSWDGTNNFDGVRIHKNYGNIAKSIFGKGIITFSIDCIIRTPPNYNIYITGAPNFVKPGAHPLSGVYEADWAPYTFTMNWQLTDGYRVINFNKNDPICFFFPVLRNTVEDMIIIKKRIDTNPELLKQYNQFSNSRSKFIEDKIKTPTSDWQKHYFKGQYPDGSKCPFNHQTKLNIKTINENNS